jgi:hypothetical protein
MVGAPVIPRLSNGLVRKSAVILAATAGLLSAASSAHAQTLACPAGEDALLTYPPDYIREGATWIAGVGSDGAPARVASAKITVELIETPLLLDEDGEGRIVMPPVEPGNAEIVMSFEWDQDVGTQAACHGVDDYVVPLVKSGEKVGRPDVYRLEGTYRVKYARDRPGTFTWRLSPTCDYFGCSIRVRSSGGLKARIKLRADGVYEIRRPRESGYGSCTVRNNLTGSVRTFEPAYTMRRVIALRKRSTGTNPARLAVGTVTDTYSPTPAARDNGCTGDTKRQRITLRRR